LRREPVWDELNKLWAIELEMIQCCKVRLDKSKNGERGVLQVYGKICCGVMRRDDRSNQAIILG
jgi:hypothetical protein